MPLPLFSTEASGFPPLRRIRDSGNLSQPFAAARQNGTCMPPLALFGAGSSANPPRAEETEKEGEDGKRKRLQGFPPPSGAYAIRGTFRNRLPLRGRAEHACHRLPRAERVHRRSYQARRGSCFVLFGAGSPAHPPHRRAGGLQTGRHAAAGRGYLSRLKS